MWADERPKVSPTIHEDWIHPLVGPGSSGRLESPSVGSPSVATLLPSVSLIILRHTKRVVLAISPAVHDTRQDINQDLPIVGVYDSHANCRQLVQ